MLGATDGGHVSIPPKPRELSETQSRDWDTGKELIKTCMATHDTKTCVNAIRLVFSLLEVKASLLPQPLVSRDRALPTAK
jgi:hypothetical protein